jgi:hypothetical protein
LDPRIINDPKFDFETFVKNDLSKEILKIEDCLFIKVEETYSKSLIHQIFRNYTKCRVLRQQFVNAINNSDQ